MPYEMFLTTQWVHLNCRKYRVQLPTRQEGWDLFQRKSDDSLEEKPEDSIEKEKASEEYKWRIVGWYFKRIQTHSSYVILMSDIIDAKPSRYEEVDKNKGKETLIKE